MSQQHIPLKLTATRFVRAVRIFMTSDVGPRARFLLFALVALFCGISALNVVNSFVGRNFMTAIADKQTAEFIRQAVIYTCAFAASTVVSVIARFSEERLALLWREFLTRRAVGLYMSGSTFYRLSVSGTLSHPDQRIADDISAFTITTLSFVLMLLNSGLTILTFSGVLWSISPLLFIAAVFYAAFGSYMTILLGRPLIGLTNDQLDTEAAFRTSLIRVRENAESIAVAGDQSRHAGLLLRKFETLATNFSRIIVVNRNLGFFTNGYNWMIQIIPVVIIAPAFIRGDMEFGVITQSAAAFAMLVGAFSFIVRQFKSISNFAAVVARISSLLEAVEEAREPQKSDLELGETEGRLAYEHVTLSSPTEGNLIEDLSISIPAEGHVLVAGAREAAVVALFRATAGIGVPGHGRILRPGPNEIRFLPQRPYLTPGSLRQALVCEERSNHVSDEDVVRTLGELNLDHIISLAGGLDKDQDWATLLSHREHQLLAIAAALIAHPRFALMEKGDVVLGQDLLRQVLRLLSERKITCINFGEADTPRSPYDAVLECQADGSWSWTDLRA